MTLDPEAAQHAATDAALSAAFKDSFMQPYIALETYFEVDTSSGTEIVPTDVVGRTMDVHVEALLNYLDGAPNDLDAMCEVQTGWLCRMTAPGYLDCTSWNAFESWGTAAKYLIDTFGDM